MNDEKLKVMSIEFLAVLKASPAYSRRRVDSLFFYAEKLARSMEKIVSIL